MAALTSNLVGTVVRTAAVGDHVPPGGEVVVIESMKMEYGVEADDGGVVSTLHVAPGDTVAVGDVLATLESAGAAASVEEPSTDAERADLAEVVARKAYGLDEARPDAVAKRHGTGRRTARENLADLVDEGSFIEFGALALAAQRRRREIQELIERTPADGLVGGIGTVNADRFGEDDTQCVVASYDYMVLAGTQGYTNHRKKDRLFELAERRRLPVIFFAEGGGGRPGDTDWPGASWLDCLAFALFGGLAGNVPLIGINAGYCFAGNAALLGTCDVVISTEDSYLGMGGPAMIEGGGLGTFAPTDIGPTDAHVANGGIDVLVADEAEATAVAKKLLAYTQGAETDWEAPDPEAARNVVPADRKRAYDMRDALATIVDIGSSLELRPDWTPGLITMFARVEGRPVGIVANNPTHLAGAVDHGAAVKAGDFLQLCDRWDVPVLYVCDTPGFMVGPDSDAEGLPRSAGALFRIGATLSVPFGLVVTRKAYGLGAQAMAGGSLKEPLFAVSWPTGEFGPMGLEGAVRLGFSRELAAEPDETARAELFEELVDTMYEHGRATNVASHFEIDDVIDPADTRRWVSRLLS